MNRSLFALLGVLGASLAACSTSNNQARAAPKPHGPGPENAVLVSAPSSQLREVFPHVRVDPEHKFVEFDGRISPMLVPDARAPRFYLELTVCSPDTREHETFVVTRARPSHIHAAMLALGLKPGHPGSFKSAGDHIEPVDPAGDRVEVRLVYTINGKEVEADPLEWIVNHADQPGFLAEERAWAKTHGLPVPGWVFAGSRFVTYEGREVYDSDGTGVVIGLTTFGSELIGWSRTISPDSVIQTPEWIADLSKTPPADLPVRVRIRAAK